MEKIKNYTFKEFKEFLAEKCYDLKMYKDGKYDRKIYNWFDLNKPRRIELFDNKKPSKKK